MNVSAEDYLRVIYSLFERNQDKKQGIKSIDISRDLKISRPSVSAMIKKLARLGYLKADSYSKIFMTKKGWNEAKRIMHNHRIIEVFLADILGYGINKVHEEAHRLEHAFSEESIRRLDNFLNNPKLSPLGMRIPHNNKFEVNVMNKTLDKLKRGQEGRIITVSGKGRLHKRILDMGIVKGAKVKVERVAPLGDPIEIKVKRYSLSLRKEEAKNIEVAVE